MKKKIIFIVVCIIVLIFTLFVFLKSETYKKMQINSKLKQIDSDDIDELKRAQSFFVKKGKTSIPILKDYLKQKHSKHSKRVVLSLIGAISYSDYYTILRLQIGCPPENQVCIGPPSYIALEKMSKEQLIFLYDSYNKQLSPKDISDVKRLLYAIKHVAKSKKWDLRKNGENLITE